MLITIISTIFVVFCFALMVFGLSKAVIAFKADADYIAQFPKRIPAQRDGESAKLFAWRKKQAIRQLLDERDILAHNKALENAVQ